LPRWFWRLLSWFVGAGSRGRGRQGQGENERSIRHRYTASKE